MDHKKKQKRFELRLSDEADAALTQIKEATGLSRAGIIEMVLRDEVRRRSVIVVDNGQVEAIRTAEGKASVQPWRSGPIPKPGQKGKK